MRRTPRRSRLARQLVAAWPPQSRHNSPLAGAVSGVSRQTSSAWQRRSSPSPSSISRGSPFMAQPGLFNLVGKVAAVIGGASGIGEAIAKGAAGQGASVTVLDANEDSARTVASRIGGDADPLELDIRDRRAVGMTLNAIARDHGRLDIVICTPSINVRKPILQYTDEEFDRVVDVNLKGSFNVLQGAGAIMKSAQRGSIVLFSSI